MDNLSKRLDDEARKVGGSGDALERVKRRASRRRVARQVGTGALALGIAAGGFALAVAAFDQRPGDRPLAGPSVSPSPPTHPVVFVIGPRGLQDEADEVAARLVSDGYNIEARGHCPSCPVPERTKIQYRTTAVEAAEAIHSEFLPGAALEAVAWPPNRGDIHVTLGADYEEISRIAVRVLIIDGSGLEGAADAAATILEGEGYDVVDIRSPSSTSYQETFITCTVRLDFAAEALRKAVFPGADIRPEIPQEGHEITLHVGEDFYDDYAGLIPG